VLGASLHDVLTRLKAEAQLFSKLDLIYDHDAPVTEPVVVNLPKNGMRLRFDGPEQRLRLIEVLDFTKNHLIYQSKDIFRHATTSQTNAGEERATGPSMRHIQHHLMGPAFPGDYLPPNDDDSAGEGLYIMSYPGVAFSFVVNHSAWKAKKDQNSFLNSHSGTTAVSMAVFPGELWPEVRETLFEVALNPRELQSSQKNRDLVPEEVCAVKIHGGGKLEVVRHEGVRPYLIQLGVTTPQDLVASLGPPDAVYRKYDKRMTIHQARPSHRNQSRGQSGSRFRDDSTDTDVSSAHTITDDSDDADDGGEIAGNVSGECFYNYFYHGFDVLLAPPIEPSQSPPSKKNNGEEADTPTIVPGDSSRIVATKFILHSNVPGSYPFNRHRRCRWELDYLVPTKKQSTITSETPFPIVRDALYQEWKGIYKNEEEAKNRLIAMPLNRDWDNSPDSSLELVGTFEESVRDRRSKKTGNGDSNGLASTELYGFPGLVFEVLSNGTVSNLTVF
jgi:hypothetical protein